MPECLLGDWATQQPYTSGFGWTGLWLAQDVDGRPVLGGHVQVVVAVSVDFDPAGDLLATASIDGTTRLWGAASEEELLAISGENNGPDLEFSPDGRLLAANSGSGKVIVYAVHLDDLLALARSRLTRSLTQAECQRYLRVADCPG